MRGCTEDRGGEAPAQELLLGRGGELQAQVLASPARVSGLTCICVNVVAADGDNLL